MMYIIRSMVGKICLHFITWMVLRTWRYYAIPVGLLGLECIEKRSQCIVSYFFGEFMMTPASTKRTWSSHSIPPMPCVDTINVKKNAAQLSLKQPECQEAEKYLPYSKITVELMCWANRHRTIRLLIKKKKWTMMILTLMVWQINVARIQKYWCIVWKSALSNFYTNQVTAKQVVHSIVVHPDLRPL